MLLKQRNQIKHIDACVSMYYRREKERFVHIEAHIFNNLSKQTNLGSSTLQNSSCTAIYLPSCKASK